MRLKDLMMWTKTMTITRRLHLETRKIFMRMLTTSLPMQMTSNTRKKVSPWTKENSEFSKLNWRANKSSL